MITPVPQQEGVSLKHSRLLYLNKLKKYSHLKYPSPPV